MIYKTMVLKSGRSSVMMEDKNLSSMKIQFSGSIFKRCTTSAYESGAGFLFPELTSMNTKIRTKKMKNWVKWAIISCHIYSFNDITNLSNNWMQAKN